MPNIISICRAAWNATKKAHQPAFDDLVVEYRNMLQARAEAAIANGVSGDKAFVLFEARAVEESEAQKPAEPDAAPEDAEVIEPPQPEPARAKKAPAKKTVTPKKLAAPKKPKAAPKK